jgi:hypothetical protein
MGWLGWDLNKAMRSDCLAIQIAYEGRCDMFNAIFGRGGDTPSPSRTAKGPPLTPELFDRVFG